jgi:hypothetical protein
MGTTKVRGLVTVIVEREMSSAEVEEREKWAAGAYARDLAAVKETRRNLYTQISDPLFFKSRRGENTEQVWLDAVAAIDAENPYPVQAVTP